MSNQADQLALFIDLTGATEDRAKFFLESSGWQLEVAVASFFETENDNEMDPDSPEVLEQVTNPPERFVPEPQAPPQSRPSGTKKSKSKSKSYSSSSNRVRTLASYRQESDSEDSGNEEGQAFYAGGSDSSGQQILGPSKNKNRGDKEDLVAQMFKSVQEHGAEVVDPNAPPSAGPSNSFGGRGYRLGQTPDDIEEVTGGGPSRQAPQVEVTLRMWREGFTVNDGPLKKYSDPENKEFLECIRKGEVPRELVREARGSEVHVNIENKSHEDPGPYKPKVKAFAGKGNVLGSPVPSSVATDVSVAPTDPKSKEEAEEAAKQQVSVDASQPSTTIQVRLTDGSTIVARLNHSHTVADLRRYITVARPQYAAAPFSLHTTFPRKELSDDSQSVQAAGLLNAAVLQRLG